MTCVVEFAAHREGSSAKTSSMQDRGRAHALTERLTTALLCSNHRPPAACVPQVLCAMNRLLCVHTACLLAMPYPGCHTTLVSRVAHALVHDRRVHSRTSMMDVGLAGQIQGIWKLNRSDTGHDAFSRRPPACLLCGCSISNRGSLNSVSVFILKAI